VLPKYKSQHQQILPVIVRGSQAEIVQACIKYLSLWQETTVLLLTENKQLEGGTVEDRQFAEWLLKVGWGQNNHDAGLLELPTSMCCGEQIEDLIKSIYPVINQLNPHRNNDEFFQHCTILSARNDDIDAVNAQVLCEMQGDIHTFQS
jgi:ATP-dependent DNA helicase PIF1